MKYFLFLFTFLLCCSVYAVEPLEKESDFSKNFLVAKQYLSHGKIQKALPYLLYLQKQQPKNDNLKYLIGLCYAEAEIVNPKTIELLKEASAKTSLNYNPNDLYEKRVPIYVYYYLSLAYAQNKECENAKTARKKFLKLYPYKDKYYIETSKKWITYCENLSEQPEVKALPTFPDFEPIKPDKKIEISGGLLMSRIADSTATENKEIKQKAEITPKKSIKTKLVEYSTNSPLYGVQLGAFSDAIPVRRFKNLKNVDAFRDHDGLIRYVIGHFSYHSQAVSLMEVIRSKGYKDAFIVDVNDERKYKDEVVSINDVNIKANQNEKIEFRIQIGAFKEELTASSAELYMKVEGITEFSDRNFTYLTVGKFEDYKEAKIYLQGITDAGIDDAFVIAVSKGEKIPLQSALGINEK
mgnify:CR=1 FL=1